MGNLKRKLIWEDAFISSQFNENLHKRVFAVVYNFSGDQDDNYFNPSCAEAPKRRLEEQRKNNPSISDLPPPSSPHKAVDSPSTGGDHRRGSPSDIFGHSPRGSRAQAFRLR
ncbi:hypothetical protein SLS64_013905 [Diaporthe eres]